MQPSRRAAVYGSLQTLYHYFRLLLHRVQTTALSPRTGQVMRCSASTHDMIQLLVRVQIRDTRFV